MFHTLARRWQHATSSEHHAETNEWNNLLRGVWAPVETCLLSQYWCCMLLLSWRVVTSVPFSPLSHLGSFPQEHAHTHTNEGRGPSCCYSAAVLSSSISKRDVWHQPHTTKQTAAGQAKPFSSSVTSLTQADPLSFPSSLQRMCPMTNINLQCMIKSMEWSICYNKKRTGDISLAYTIPTSPLLPLPLTVPKREESAHFRWAGSPLIPACWDAE